MHHKITHAMVGIVVGAFVILAAVFGLVSILNGGDAEAAAAGRPVIPPIAHPVNKQMSDCAACHAVGEAGMPASHATYGQNTCLTCHAVASEEELAARDAARQQEAQEARTGGQGPSAIPHPAGEAYAKCVACHALGGNRGMPENHASYANEMCTSCHSAVGAEAPAQGAETATVSAGPLVPHEIGGQFINCDACHAFDMGRLAMPESHQGFTRETCTNCHKPEN